MDDKLISTINKIVRLCKENPEFDGELRKKLSVASYANTISFDDERINQIYEYCIENVIRKQADEFYSNFPILSIRETLIKDFCRMEAFRRKDNFGDFCLSAYQQIECITNYICTNTDICFIAERMWGYPAYIKTGSKITPTLENRSDSNYSVASLVFPGTDYNTGLSNAVEKSKSTLQALKAKDKINCVVYFLGYKAAMKNSDYDSYKEFTSLLSHLYQCRNMNHRGNQLNTWKMEEVLEKIIHNKAVYYLKFSGALTQYVEKITEGWSNIPRLKNYCETLPPKSVNARPKIVEKI